MQEAVTNGALKLAHKFGPILVLLVEMVQAHFEGARRISLVDVCAIIICLAYIVSTIDAIPDFVPVIGFLDDATVLAIAVSFLDGSITDFKRWKEENNFGRPFARPAVQG